MKLGASYNLFDGEELLEGSIDSIRNNVDYISIIYQHTSNFGQKNDDSVFDLLRDLKKSGKVDEVLLYEPFLNRVPHVNEFNKRQLSRNTCLNAGCDTFMYMDSDEFYIEEDFIKAKERFIEEDKDISVCRLYTYFKDQNYILEPIEDYYVALFYKLTSEITPQLGGAFPYMIDPCRRTTCKSWFEYPEDEIVMHHLSYVRKDIRKKFINSSARQNLNPYIDQCVKYMDTWKYPEKAMMIGMDITYYDVKKVDFWKNKSIIK